jgi:hypothetical protein
MLGASIHYPLARRGYLEVHRRHQRRSRRLEQPVITRREGRRADGGGRRLRRGGQRHPGAHACLRAEVRHDHARPAPRSRPTWCDMVEHGFGLSEASQYARADGAAHPRLPCARQLQCARQSARRRCPPAQLMDGAGRLRLCAPRAPARHLPAREAEVRGAHSGCAPVHRRKQASTSCLPGPNGDLGIIVQGGLYEHAGARSLQQFGAGRCLWRRSTSRRSC